MIRPVTPIEVILDAAYPEESPLHKLFEWNDEIAAEQYRRLVER